MARPVHILTLDPYTLDDLRALLATRPLLRLSPEVERRIETGAQYVQKKAREDRYIYGVNTGFGSLCETRIETQDMGRLQYNILLSHACGVGDFAPEEVSRLTLLLKVLTFRTGHTGISLATVQQLLAFWNADCLPATPRKGTVGASGDLAPLAHMSLPLLGLGKVYVQGLLMDASAALARFNWEPLTLQPKEGLALINGVQYITAIAFFCLLQIEELVISADVIAALSIQAFSTSRTFYHALYHSVSAHPERSIVAANLRHLLEGSNHFALSTCNRSMQDPYSFRCIPQVAAAIRQTVRFARETLEQEANSVGDNPLFFPEDDQILFGGNLHGESTAFMLDFLAIALSELASISERRSYQLLSGLRGLPDFLATHPGINSGFMVAQYTAAALVNENKLLSTPASVDTIPTSQLQEDHVSMGGTAAYKLCQIVENCEYVLAIELLIASQAVQLNRQVCLSPLTRAVLQDFRQEVPFLEQDAILSDDIEDSRLFLRRRRDSWRKDLGLL